MKRTPAHPGGVADAALVLVRFAHVLAMALAAGGAALLWAAPSARAARAYEALFWGAASALLATGVGNLGAMGSVPGVDTTWGARFAWKLALVGGLLVGSALRTLVVVLAPEGATRLLRGAYAATTLAVGVVAALGVALAHA